MQVHLGRVVEVDARQIGERVAHATQPSLRVLVEAPPRALVDRVAACLLGTHVGNRAEDHPVGRRGDRRQRRGAGIGGRARRRLGSGIRFGQADVEQLHNTGSSDPDVGRLQVSMHDATPVSRVERLGYLARNRQHLVDRQRSACRDVSNGKKVRQRAASSDKEIVSLLEAK